MRIGIIGAGRIAERHVAAYKQLGHHDILLTDLNGSIAERRSRDWSVACVGNPTQLMERDDLDAIDICAPTPFHAKYAIAALDRGKHVFCEKPLCLTLDEARRIEAAARRASRTVMVGFLYRFYPAFEFVKTLLEERIIGAPYMALIRLGGRGSASAWKHQGHEGGGAVTEMMVHMLDLSTWYFGPLEEVQPLWQTTLLPERRIGAEDVTASAEDFSVVRLRAGQVEILCESDLATPSYMQHIDIQGDNGSVFASILHFLPTVVYCKEPRGIYDRGNNIYTFPQENVFEKELGHFLDVVGGAPHDVNGLEDSIHVVGLMERIREGGRRPPTAPKAQNPLPKS